MIDIVALFEKYEDEFGEFGRVENKRSKRSDLHALLLLDELVPSNRDIISAAEHGEIWLDVEPQQLAEVATEAQILELIRCGVEYDSDLESFTMFV